MKRRENPLPLKNEGLGELRVSKIFFLGKYRDYVLIPFETFYGDSKANQSDSTHNDNRN